MKELEEGELDKGCEANRRAILSPSLRKLLEAGIRATQTAKPKQATRAALVSRDVWKKGGAASMSEAEQRELMRVRMQVQAKRWRHQLRKAMRDCWLYIKSEEAQHDNIIKQFIAITRDDHHRDDSDCDDCGSQSDTQSEPNCVPMTDDLQHRKDRVVSRDSKAYINRYLSLTFKDASKERME